MALPGDPHLFTLDEYERMIAAGILTEDMDVELIRGAIIERASEHSPPHGTYPQIEEHRFTRDEYERMLAAGVFGKDACVALICGAIVEMAPIN